MYPEIVTKKSKHTANFHHFIVNIKVLLLSIVNLIFSCTTELKQAVMNYFSNSTLDTVVLCNFILADARVILLDADISYGRW